MLEIQTLRSKNFGLEITVERNGFAVGGGGIA